MATIHTSFPLTFSMTCGDAGGALFHCPLSRVMPWISQGEGDRQSRRWQGNERRIDWSIGECFHISAHSFKNESLSSAGRAFRVCTLYSPVYRIKDERVSGRAKELSGFYSLVHLHASSCRCLPLTFALFCLWVSRPPLSHFPPQSLRLASRSVSVSSVLLQHQTSSSLSLCPYSISVFGGGGDTGLYRAPKCRLNRSKKSFVPLSITKLNNRMMAA